MKKLIYIILKNHDGLKFTVPCIESLKKISYKNKKILVIDDNSKYVPSVECKKMGVELIRLRKYSDFCKSFNMGIRHALKKGADYIFIINNDTRNFSVNYFEKVVEAFEDPRVGMVGSKCLNYDGTTQWGKRPHVNFKISMNVPTCGYVLSSDMLRQIGGFDNALYRYYEDLDLIIRLRSCGWKSVYISSVSFEHFGSGTSDKMPYITNFYQSRNLIWFIKQHCKNHTILQKARYLLNYLIPQFRLLLNKDHKITFFFSIIKGISVGFFTPWRINHEI